MTGRVLLFMAVLSALATIWTGTNSAYAAPIQVPFAGFYSGTAAFGGATGEGIAEGGADFNRGRFSFRAIGTVSIPRKREALGPGGARSWGAAGARVDRRAVWTGGRPHICRLPVRARTSLMSSR